MKQSSVKTITLAAIAIVVFSLVPFSVGQNQTQDTTASFIVQNQSGVNYELNVTIPQSLYEYYVCRGHSLFSEQDFGRFTITPKISLTAYSCLFTN